MFATFSMQYWSSFVEALAPWIEVVASMGLCAVCILVVGLVTVWFENYGQAISDFVVSTIFIAVFGITTLLVVYLVLKAMWIIIKY